MSTNQYNYPPPPPPPGPPPQSFPQYGGYAQPPHQQSPRGGGAHGRGRGGHHNQGGRGDFHASSPYNPHAGGYNAQAPPAGGYGPQNPAPYIGPQAPAGNQPPPQWPHEQQHQQHQQPPHYQQPQVQQPPPPVPLSAQNYHPNYAPQVYNQQPSYGPQQPFQHPPPQPSYGPNIPQSQPPPHGGPLPQQWSGPPQQPQPPYNGVGRGRGRGGHNPGRGGHEAPLMGPPIRMGFDNDRSADQMPQASNGYPQQYANPQQSPPVPYSQPAYQGYPPQNFSHRGGHRQPLDPNPFHSHPHRGRGSNNFRGRGRDQYHGDRNRFRNKNRSSGSGSNDLPQKPAGEENGRKKNKKRKTNTLGLTPHGDEHEESPEEDDADEEARLIHLLGEDTPQLPSDLAAWIEERKKRWPTKARREAQEAELAKRRAQAAEQSARDKAKAKQERDDNDATAATEKPKDSLSETKLVRQRRKAEKLRQQLEKAEKKIQEREIKSAKRKRESGDRCDEDGIGDDNVDQVIAKATSDANGMTSDETSGDSSDSDSDTAKPDEVSSRNSAPIRVPPPQKAQLQRHCKYFSTGGTCGKKGKCRFVHDQPVRDQALREKELNGGRMTLAQRLILNDKDKEDLTILKTLKYLKEKGLMPDNRAASASKNEQPAEVKDEEHSFDNSHNYIEADENEQHVRIKNEDSTDMF